MTESNHAVCRAGAAKCLITPPIGVSLAGYFHDRVATSIRDDPYARALVVENADRRLALVSCDLATMTAEVSGAAKAIIARECAIPPERVLICATHTHTGPELRDNGVVPCLGAYVEELPNRIAGAVRAACDATIEATLHPGRTEVHGYAFNRLHRLKDGAEVFGLGPATAASVVGPAGPIDPELQTLTVRDLDGRVRAMAIHYALHPDVIGGAAADFISADWPGAMARTVEGVYGDGAECLFLQGTAGDINHVPYTETYMPRKGPRKAEQIGRALAGAAIYAAEKAEPMRDVTVDGAVEILSIPYYTRDAAMFAEIERLRAIPRLGAQDKYILDRFEKWPHDGKNADVPVQALRIGEMALTGFPAEVFVRIGLEVKQYSPARHTWPVELANARVSTYVPATDQAGRGAYGAKPILSRWLCADAGRRLSDAALSALHRMWAEPR